MSEKHTVHLANGAKVVVEGDRVEVFLNQPIVILRQHWIHYLNPAEELRRTLDSSSFDLVTKALEAAFAAVPMTVYPEED